MSVFVSHDGPDANGVRAEVWVEKGVGKIVNITVPKGVNARLEIKTEGFDHPQFGWTRTDDPLYPKIVEAYESKADIQYRIESQRKRDIDRSLPIGPLREDMALAKKNTNKIFAALNGEKTLEAVTSLSEDPAPNGRIPAAETPAAAPAAPAPEAQAPAQNNGSSAPRRNLQVEEEPPWAEYNSDGSVNFGSYSMQAAVGAELFVRKQLMANGEQPSADRVLNVAISLLEISDKLQAYFTGKVKARKKGSHTRVRSIVYDTVENFFPIPGPDANHDEWVKSVGRLSMERLKTVVAIFEQGAGRGNTSAPAQNANQNNGNAQKQETPAAQAPAAPQKEEAPVAQPDAAPAPEKAAEAHTEVDVEAARPSGPAPEEVPDLLSSASSAVNIFAPVDISGITGPKATKENIEVFKELVTESEAPFPKVTKLLAHTFGVNKASEVPDSVFVEFLDHYTADPEEFATALEYIDTIRK